jgi:hypothetical protein
VSNSQYRHARREETHVEVGEAGSNSVKILPGKMLKWGMLYVDRQAIQVKRRKVHQEHCEDPSIVDRHLKK